HLSLSLFSDAPTPDIYTLSLHDALPISLGQDAETMDGPFVTALVERAGEQGGTWIAGMLERSDDPERPFNTLVVVDADGVRAARSEEHTSELQSRSDLVCRLLLEKKNTK